MLKGFLTLLTLILLTSLLSSCSYQNKLYEYEVDKQVDNMLRKCLFDVEQLNETRCVMASDKTGYMEVEVKASAERCYLLHIKYVYVDEAGNQRWDNRFVKYCK